jgi:hypothetical protein
MPLTSVLSVTLRPEGLRDYEDLCREIASTAVDSKEEFTWTVHQNAFGELGRLHFVSQADDFATIGARGLPNELVLRLLGEQRGQEVLRGLAECTLSLRNDVSVDRPELSYAPEPMEPGSHPAAVVTALLARPGHQDAVEELLRKVAEAIPKVDDPARMLAMQTVIGELRQYWTVRPMASLADLDGQRTPDVLLNEAFGAAEGGLIFRAGVEALETARREIVIYREDLSNPGR